MNLSRHRVQADPPLVPSDYKSLIIQTLKYIYRLNNWVWLYSDQEVWTTDRIQIEIEQLERIFNI